MIAPIACPATKSHAAISTGMNARRMIRSAAAALAAPLALVAPPAALAQDDPANVLAGDYVTVGGAVIYGPSYEGSDDMVASPVPVLSGRLGGIDITPRPGGVALDLIPDGDGARTGFSLGPVVTYSGNRRRQIEDPVVRAAGRLKSAIDVGVNGGVTMRRVLNDYDSVTISADAKWNVNDAHGGMTVSPQVSYFTPLSPAMVVALSASAKHVDDDYARYYYSVSPLQATRSGLPQFAAKGSWASASIGLLTAYDLGGDLRDGGFSLIGLASYTRLMNDAKRTPFTSIRGDADQWLVGAGIAYTF